MIRRLRQINPDVGAMPSARAFVLRTAPLCGVAALRASSAIAGERG
jgi:hypothetical protein